MASQEERQPNSKERYRKIKNQGKESGVRGSKCQYFTSGPYFPRHQHHHIATMWTICFGIFGFETLKKDNNFLNHSDNTPQGFGYAVFGKVVKGMEVVDRIGKAKTTTSGPYRDVPAKPVIIKSVKRLGSN